MEPSDVTLASYHLSRMIRMGERSKRVALPAVSRGNPLIVYSATKQHFLSDNNDRDIDAVILSSFKKATGHRVSENEQRAWRDSLGFMARVLTDDAIPLTSATVHSHAYPSRGWPAHHRRDRRESHPPFEGTGRQRARLLKGNHEFVLIDDQKTVFEAAKAAAVRATQEAPQVVIIEGGPGTGKSVVAVNLLSDLLVAGRIGTYVSKNAAPRKVYEAKLARQMTASRFRSLFAGSGSFIEAPKVSNDFLVVDEAHRLNEKSGLYGNLGDHQVKEIMASSNCSIFFVDEDQRVTFKDVGTKAVIRSYAEQRGALVEEHTLLSQFRCAGSDGYIAWLDDVLGIRPTANTTLPLDDFDFHFFDSHNELNVAIEAKNAANKARVVAGYCWPWRSKADASAIDIEIGATIDAAGTSTPTAACGSSRPSPSPRSGASTPVRDWRWTTWA